jgi:hypothetical protein
MPWRPAFNLTHSRQHSTPGSDAPAGERQDNAGGKEIVVSNAVAKNDSSDWFDNVQGTPAEKAAARLLYVKESIDTNDAATVMKMMSRIISKAHSEGSVEDQRLMIVLFEAHTLCATLAQKMDRWDEGLKHFQGAIR